MQLLKKRDVRLWQWLPANFAASVGISEEYRSNFAPHFAEETSTITQSNTIAFDNDSFTNAIFIRHQQVHEAFTTDSGAIRGVQFYH